MITVDASYFVGLDPGTSKIAVAVGASFADERFGIYGVGQADTRGMRNGTVLDPNALTEAVASAVEKTERVAGLEIAEVHLGLSGAHLLGINGRGAVTTDRVIDWSDSHRAFEAAVSAVAIPDGREILQVIQQDFIVDGQDGITRPAGLTTVSPLEARAHVITYGAAYGTALMDCVRRAGLRILSTRSSLMGTSEAVLTPDEKELGVALIDIGVESTGVAIFERGLLRDTRTLDLGRSSFTRGVADGLRLPRAGAARFFRLVYDAVPEAKYALNAGLVLTGEGAFTSGMADAAEEVFDLPVRHGRSALTADLATQIEGPHFTAAVGLAQVAHRHASRPSVVPRLSPPPGAWTG